MRSPKQLTVQIFIFIQALFAMLGSLYYSNFGDPVKNIAQGFLFHGEGGLEPCHLCWWARILMYPLVFISAMGLIKKDNRFTDYILPLAIPGFILEVYHYLTQKVFTQSFFECGTVNPCSATQAVDYFGFITIPFLCFTAFGVIIILSGINTVIEAKQSKA
ncbi:disulfide bond formation protein B [Candidatus Gracilibacteria bacterium CG17_big_fil_post_rev_8_21_14_2_50_48_13]|nr:MAG: disulfide bond formation protein B [Candidatus Gracilibacteria bacterium CG17_big_fil_post_rev_8_21_14_2_50_48_13]